MIMAKDAAVRSQRMIEARARMLGITSSELARRAIEAYDPERDEQALELLAAELAAVVDQTEAKIDGALAELARLRRYFAEIDAERGEGDR